MPSASPNREMDHYYSTEEDMDVYKPSKEDMDSAEQELRVKLERFGAVSDLGGTDSIVNEVVDKVSELVASPDDTAEEESKTDPLLPYLEAEKKLLCARKRTGVAASRRPLPTRRGSGDSAPLPHEDNSELFRRIASVVSGKGVEYKACSQEQYCAELVSKLTGMCAEAKPWTASSSDARYAERPTVLDRMLLKVSRIALSRLVETEVRGCLEDEDETELPKELARYVGLTAKLDAEEARRYVHVQDLSAQREERAVYVRTLLAQGERLRGARENVEQRESHVGIVIRGVCDLHDSLASRVQLCKSLVAAADNVQAVQARQENAAAAAATSVCLDDDPVGAVFDQRCSQLVAAMAAIVDQLDQMQLRRERMTELVDRLEADMTARCQGSMSKWHDGVRANTLKRNGNLKLLRALFIEFHTNPTRFVSRMKTARMLKARGTLPVVQQKKDDAKHP
ncbi:uncharacterized protein LOC119389559 [Rhipicephalus sanguineus]|uniref:Uncharacterized protein n=1 Tax=Rhipicephalus sanguineus TaxID=34632 RepID=A0A9D4SZ01_RHISA|nr:uncharacterized protein LOC119389559 [Rhipicephalus sanguineus]KAH7957515.1 hypothetical protein HPB52_019713 [Rhipicephalus sanguineus]